VRGNASCQVVSHRLLEVETHQAVRRYGLKPSKAALALPLKRHGLRRAIYVKATVQDCAVLVGVDPEINEQSLKSFFLGWV
jgi:hypothetical protein